MTNIRANRQRPEEQELQHAAFKWLATLPPAVRPLALGRHYPRIVNRVALIWSDATVTDRYLSELLVPARRGRRGFPDEVARELNRVYLYHRKRLEATEASAWMEAGHDDRFTKQLTF